MRTFLLIFDTRTSMADVHPIEDRATALQRLRSAESRLAAEPWLEVVLLAAADEDDLRRTHAHYFESLGELLEPA